MPKENTYYFQHDYNARNDPKIVRLFMNHGVCGVGIFWCIVEMLFEQGGYLKRTECERIAFELRIDRNVIDQILESDLFKKDDERFWSESVLKRIDERKKKSLKCSESAKLGWSNANGMRTHSNRNTIKGNKIKEKKIYRGIEILPEKHAVVFEDGTEQRLGKGQKELLDMGKLKPEDVTKGLIN